MAKKIDPTKEDSSYPLYAIPYTDQPVGGKTDEPSAESIGVPGIKKAIYDHSDLANIPIDFELTVVTAQIMKADPLFSSPLPVRDTVVKAGVGNGGTIYVGGLNCSYPLAAGEGVVLAIRDMNKIRWKGDTAGDKLYVLSEGF